MKARRGQIAVYLVLVLVAITILVLMNVGTFLGVSAKNTTMNAGDAAALAVAAHQGVLLNRIGNGNVDHLKAALAGDVERCEEIVREQLRESFLGPLEGIRIGNDWAKKNGCERDEGMRELLSRHAADVRLYYLTNPDTYPEPWEGAWEEYATALELAISDGVWAGPDNIDFVDAAIGHTLLDRNFYAAIASSNWCWFHFFGEELLSNYSSFRDWDPLPLPDSEVRRRHSVNSEIYSLNLDVRAGSAIEVFGTNALCRLTGATLDEVRMAPLLHDRSQRWMFLDTSYTWRPWYEIDPAGEWHFPAMGRVRPEYDVRGCAAICRVTLHFPNVVTDGGERVAVWSGAAKPFGVLSGDFAEAMEGEVPSVTAFRGLVTPSFGDVRLVPLDSVGGRDLSTADPAWMFHVRHHLGRYLENGPDHLNTCSYCQQLVEWERPSLRAEGVRWLRLNSRDCTRPHGGGNGRGGTSHGH